MHEETHKPVVTQTGTLIIEEGQDSTIMGELKLRVENRRVKDWKFTPTTLLLISMENSADGSLNPGVSE